MELEDFMGKYEKEELIALLSSYVPNEHRIYLNDYYYQAHQNYMNNKIENI